MNIDLDVLVRGAMSKFIVNDNENNVDSALYRAREIELFFQSVCTGISVGTDFAGSISRVKTSRAVNSEKV